MFNTSNNTEATHIGDVLNIGTEETLRSFGETPISFETEDATTLLEEIATTYGQESYDTSKRLIIAVWLTETRSSQYLNHTRDLMDDSNKEYDSNKLRNNEVLRKLINTLVQSTELELLPPLN